MTTTIGNVFGKINLLNEVGIALSSEKNFSSLLEQILIGAKKITNADGGTIYLLNADKKLKPTHAAQQNKNLKWLLCKPIPWIFT